MTDKKCPMCGSRTGFKIEYSITGGGFEVRNFEGDVLDSERETYDINEKAYCLDCNLPLSTVTLNV